VIIFLKSAEVFAALKFVLVLRLFPAQQFGFLDVHEVVDESRPEGRGGSALTAV
jgi:hypothetical protein